VNHDVDTTLGTLSVGVIGSGPAMLMWPSLLLDKTMWDAQVDHFRSRFTTVAIDPPGHGASSPLTRDITLDECATCVVEVLDALHLERAHFLGSSWGAMVGGVFAARHPDRVGHSVLMNGTASTAQRRQRVEYRALLRVGQLLGGVKPPLTRSVVRAFLGRTSRQHRPDAVGAVLEVAGRNDMASVSHAVRSIVPDRPDHHQLFSTITTPVLVIGGREDTTFPLNELESMAEAIPHSELVILDDASHLVALEVPDTVNALIDTFLDHAE
jgi:3-oxoadipate enol-lactonase